MSLPVHGFVLAGGRSSRMGTDKALLTRNGVTLVESAVKRLEVFCATVSVVGNRPDLAVFAPVVAESRIGCGPIAGLEAGLASVQKLWTIFTPVDVPLVGSELLRAWAELVLTRATEGIRVSYLQVLGDRQPTFCMLHRDVLPRLTDCAEQGKRRVVQVLEEAAGSSGTNALWVARVEDLAPSRSMQPEVLNASFLNVNTPEDWAELQAYGVSRRESGRVQLQ